MKNSATVFKLNLKELFPFPLDDFQLKAIAALDAGKSVVVAAPTGSGKTLIGEYAIYRALSRGKRVFYTTPLKALSNQKFRDFQEQFSIFQEKSDYPYVGLITGDEVENPEAPIVVMTTEIFRNMLYETPIGQVGTSLENVEAIVLDECHYISDRQRGTVWEESIIYCPPTIQLVALSATIGNPEELTDWINQVRFAARNKTKPEAEINTCELINSNFRPVPLRFYFCNNQGLYPLLSNKNKINPHLKPTSHKLEGGNTKRAYPPAIGKILGQLQERDMLPAIYLIFSRRACDQAVDQLDDLMLVNDEEAKHLQVKLLEFFLADNLELQEKLLQIVADYPEFYQKLLAFLGQQPESTAELCQFLTDNPDYKDDLFQFLSTNSQRARVGQVEPLLRGIAAHHAGILPDWKKLVEELFEVGLVKVVFATATLAAGINMPARTTVISALSKRSDDGHRMLTPSEFLQIAGRAGRRGMDTVGHVVTLQTRFEGAKEAAYLATAEAEPLRSWFTPSYGMVLNLLQKHTIDEAKDLLERSFAEYLAQLKLIPEEKVIADITTELARIDVELASVEIKHFASYEKLREQLKEEQRLLEILQQQAEASRKRQIAPLLSEIKERQILALKGKHVRVASPMMAVVVTKIPGSGQAPDLVGLGLDNRWYIATNADVVDIYDDFLPESALENLPLPELENVKLGKWRKGNETTAVVSKMVADYAATRLLAPEVREQQIRTTIIQEKLENHPLQKLENPGHLIKRHKHRLFLRDKLHSSQVKYQKHQSHKSYYWEDFLNLIELLRQFNALDGFHPTPLGEAAATIRGENELWLGLALMSGELENLEPVHLAAVISALITETPRPDSWTNYQRSQEVLEVLANLQKIRKQLIKVQRTYDIAFPVWLERDFVGLVEVWALGEQFGVEWGELWENTSLDEGDIVRMLRRTIDVLWQIPQVPGISENLKTKAREAISLMKRFPI